MSDSLPLGLAQQENARPVDPDQLEQMGKKAAAQYRDTGVSLSKCVVDIVKEARLAPEQVKRVCEFANTDAYLEEFNKAGEAKNVTFDGGPADPGYVLKELNDGSSPMVSSERSDYKKASALYKSASAANALADMFGISGIMQKEASVDHSSHADPLNDLIDLREQLKGVSTELTSRDLEALSKTASLAQELVVEARQAILSGLSAGEIKQAWINSKTVPEDGLKYASAMLRAHLLDNGHRDEEVASSFLKIAGTHLRPNPEHPLIVKLAAWYQARHEEEVLRAAIQLTETKLGSVNAKIKELSV